MQPKRQLRRTSTLPLHPQLQCPHRPHPQPTLQRTHNAPQVYALGPQALPHSLINSRQHATQHIRVTAQKLGATMHDNMGTQRQRPLQRRRAKRRIDAEQRTARARQRCVVR